MNNIKLCGWGVLLCAVSALTGCITGDGGGRGGTIWRSTRILMKDGIPCFSVENGREERENPPRISTISVRKETLSGDVSLLWEREFPRGRHLPPHKCLTYGSGTELTSKLHQQLQPVTPYRVRIEANINGDKVYYTSSFCLYETPEGTTEVHHALSVCENRTTSM